MTEKISDLRKVNPDLDSRLVNNSGKYNQRLLDDVKKFVVDFFKISEESYQGYSWNSISHEFVVDYK